MKTKLLIALALTMIALSLIGYSYACQNGGIHINCCQPNCNIKFKLATTSDNENTKEVATTTAQIINDGNTIQAYISNGYPGYDAYITDTIKNTGNCQTTSTA